MSGGRIPETIAEFNNYLNNTDDYLQAGTPTNRERLGLSVQNGTDWSAFRTTWSGTLYPKYIDPLQSTSVVKQEVRDFMKDFGAFARPLLNIMAADPDATAADESVFNFKIERAAPTHHTTPILDPVTFQSLSLNGGMVEFTCRPGHDSKNPSKHPQADSIQVAYKIQDPTTPTPDPAPAPDNELPNPDSPDMTKELFTKAVFVLNLGVTNKGKLVVIYLRWYNTKRPDLSGPWTGPTAIGVA